MPDVVTQLAAYRTTLDDLAPEITLAELESPVGTSTRSRFNVRPFMVALLAALAVLIVIGGGALLFSGEDSTPPATDLQVPQPTPVPTVEEGEPEATESEQPDRATAESVSAASADSSEARLAYDWLVGVVLEAADTLELEPVVIAPNSIVYRASSESFPGLLAGSVANLGGNRDPIPEFEFGFELFLFETPEAASAYMAARMEGTTPNSGAPAIPAGDESFPGGPCGRGCPLGQFVRSGTLLIEVKLPFDDERLDLAVTAVDAVISAAATDDSPVLEFVDAPESESGPVLHSETQIDVYDNLEDGVADFSWFISHGSESGPNEPVCNYRMSDRQGVDDTSFSYGILPDGTILDEPFQDGTELAEDDPGYRETIEMCAQYNFDYSPAEWGLTEVFAANTGYPALVEFAALEGGDYSAIAGSWHFVLDDLSSLPGVFGQGGSFTISDVRVHTDGSKQHIDSLEFTVQGPTSALEQAFGIEIPEAIQDANPIILITTSDERRSQGR